LGEALAKGRSRMRRTIWLASYPKSGNTWFRLLAANLAASGGPVDINSLPTRDGIASGRGDFEWVTLLDSGLLTHEEADALRPRVYEALVAERGDEHCEWPRLVKVHDAYVTTPSGEPLLAGARAADGAILIVRDPRDVAPSLANHRHCSLDEAIAFMNDQSSGFAAGRRAQPGQLRQRLLDWSGHAQSWLDQADVPVHLVRYEDLAARPVETFRAAMAFAGQPVSASDAARAVDHASFDRLQAQERERGFGEWRSRGGDALFFRSGRSQAWRETLTPGQVARIEAAHGPVMARLGYVPAGAAWAKARGLLVGESG
jgi:aryl sulfotransferase